VRAAEAAASMQHGVCFRQLPPRTTIKDERQSPTLRSHRSTYASLSWQRHPPEWPGALQAGCSSPWRRLQPERPAQESAAVEWKHSKGEQAPDSQACQGAHEPQQTLRTLPPSYLRQRQVSEQRVCVRRSLLLEPVELLSQARNQLLVAAWGAQGFERSSAER